MLWIEGAARAVLLAFSVLLSACVAQPPVERTAVVSAAGLLSGERFGVQAGTTLPPVALTAVNDDMRAFLRQHVPPGLGPTRTIELILQAILDEGLQLRYDNFQTLTAEEAFYTREGNCMSFTNLFVALAREAGVNARYQEVEIPPSWTAEGDTWRYNLHINAWVKLPGAEQVVDFNIGDYDTGRHRRVLSDEEALARYHNNMGVHWMTQGDNAQAFLHFRAALTLRPRTAHVWTNLGSLYRRSGDLVAAESSYLRAVNIADDAAAHSNLARLYAQLDQVALSQWHLDRVQLFRQQNPYYLLQLAREAYASADYPAADSLLRRAIRKQPQEHEFYRLLGLTELQQGDVRAAAGHFAQALGYADAEAGALYRHKLELLAEH